MLTASILDGNIEVLELNGVNCMFRKVTNEQCVTRWMSEMSVPIEKHINRSLINRLKINYFARGFLQMTI